MSLEVIVAFAAISATLAGVSVQIFFKTGSFAEEYTEIANALFLESKSQLLNQIEFLIQQRKLLPPPTSSSSLIFPEAVLDFEESTLSGIRGIGGRGDMWLGAVGRGKILLHWMAFYILLLAIVLFVFVILVVVVSVDVAALVLEYSAGPVVVLLAFYTVNYVRLVRELDNAYISLRKSQGVPR